VTELQWFAIACHHVDIRLNDGIFLLHCVHDPLYAQSGDMMIGG
jgi:hypothetical protein